MADVVVIGAGLAGARTCAALRAAGLRGSLTLVGAEDEPPYDRPPLTKDPFADVDLRRAMDLDVWSLADDVRLGVRARRLDVRTPASGDGADLVVECSDASALRCEAVVLATGADPVLPSSWRTAGAHVLHTRADARAVWSTCGPGSRLVVVGGGWIGCEVAATAASRAARVDLLEAGPKLLPGRVPRRVSLRVADWLAGAGVTVHTATHVDTIEAAPLRVGDLRADLVVAGLGMRPTTSWLAPSPVRRSPTGAVLVDGEGRSSLPGVFAVGDCAARWSRRRGAHLPGGHWTDALNDPERAAPAVLRWLDRDRRQPRVWDAVAGNPPDPIPYVFSEIAGRTLLVLGWPEAGRLVWRESGTGPSAAARSPAGTATPDVSEAWTAFTIDDADRLVGLCSVGRPRDLVAARRAMLAHPDGPPRADPQALADPAAGPASMFPGGG